MIVQASNPKLREVGAEGMGQGMDTRGMGVGWELIQQDMLNKYM